MPIFLLAFLSLFADAQTSSVCQTSGSSTISSAPPQVCETFNVRVYVHRVRSAVVPNGFGYDNSINNTIENNLNDLYNQYGIYFNYEYADDWIAPNYTSELQFPTILTNIFGDPSNDRRSNSINIYILPKDGPILANEGFGKADGIPGNAFFLAGKRNVTAYGTTVQRSYEIPTSNVIAHEMGHCLGLVHTFNFGGDDSIDDTPIDLVENNACVNPTTCQFVPNCGSCGNLASNPTTNMTNIMSYTVAPCMQAFSPKQVDLMRFNLKNSMSYVVESSTSNTTGPNLSNITSSTSGSVYTFNSVSTGYHTLFTYFNTQSLTSDISWSKTAGTSNNWGFYGTYNRNAWFSLTSGQHITLQLSATDLCATAYRTLTFVSQSAYRISSSPIFTNSIFIEFDYTEFAEALPIAIGIYNAQNGKEDKVINRHYHEFCFIA